MWLEGERPDLMRAVNAVKQLHTANVSVVVDGFFDSRCTHLEKPCHCGEALFGYKLAEGDGVHWIPLLVVHGRNTNGRLMTMQYLRLMPMR